VKANGFGLDYELTPRLIERLEDIPPPNGRMYNLWLMVDTDSELSCAVYLAFPKALSEDGRIMYCAECRMIGHLDLFPGGSDVDLLPVEPQEPPAPISDFEIELRKEQG
jgi:hypothetical protein